MRISRPQGFGEAVQMAAVSLQAQSTAQAKALAARKEHSQNSQFIAILTTAASCSSPRRENREAQSCSTLQQQAALHAAAAR